MDGVLGRVEEEDWVSSKCAVGREEEGRMGGEMGGWVRCRGGGEMGDGGGMVAGRGGEVGVLGEGGMDGIGGGAGY